MDEIGKNIIAYGASAAAIGGVVAAGTQLAKRGWGLQGRIVRQIAIIASLAFGVLIMLLNAPDGIGWKAVCLVILQGLFAGVMIALSAMGWHNGFRRTAKADAAARATAPTDESPSETEE